MQSGPKGFPNPRNDDRILAPLLVKPDNYQYAEERRLFYVALTRAKRACYLYVPSYNCNAYEQPSLFYNEIRNSIEIFDSDGNNLKICPKCEGYLIIRKKGERQFYGCSNYDGGNINICKYTESMEKHPEVLEILKKSFPISSFKDP